jgi:hypothetical protein
VKKAPPRERGQDDGKQKFSTAEATPSFAAPQPALALPRRSRWRRTAKGQRRYDAAIRERLDLDQMTEVAEQSAAIRADFEAKLRGAGLWRTP